MSEPVPQKLCFASDFGTEQVRLFEVESESMLQAIARNEVVVKGQATDEAVLCTTDHTYTVRLAESTNTLLLLPPATPDIITGSAHAVYELKQTRPKPHHLKARLTERWYRGEDEEPRENQQGLYSVDQLDQLVQSSRGELEAMLRDLGAVEIRGNMRLLHPQFEMRMLELLLAHAMEHAWPWTAVPCQGAEAALGPDCTPAAVFALLRKFGEINGEKVSLKPELIVGAKAEALLRGQASWGFAELAGAVAVALPDDFPALRTIQLRGVALVEPKGNHSAVRHFSLDEASLSDPDRAFAALFAARPVWPMDQIIPFVAPLANPPSVPVENLLLRFCFVNRMDPDHVTVSKR